MIVLGVSHATSEGSLTCGREERKKENEPTTQTQVQGTPPDPKHYSKQPRPKEPNKII